MASLMQLMMSSRILLMVGTFFLIFFAGIAAACVVCLCTNVSFDCSILLSYGGVCMLLCANMIQLQAVSLLLCSVFGSWSFV